MDLTVTRVSMRRSMVEEFLPEMEALFHQHWERLCQLLYRITGDEQEAQDLALEVFLRIYRQPPNHWENLNGWLYRVATNLGFNALRARKRRQVYEGEAAAQGSLYHQPVDPADAVIQSIEAQRVRKVVEVMKPRLARVLVLRYSGLSYAEIAEAEGLRAGSVGTLLRRAEAAFEKAYLSLENTPGKSIKEG